MPIYEYRCYQCNERFDKFVRSMSAEAKVTCPSCGSSQVRKGFSTFASRGSGKSNGFAVAPAATCAPTG